MTLHVKHKAAWLALLAVAAATLACSGRERTNPLDPGNPDRARSNVGFNALAGNSQVLIEWDRLDFIDLAGVRVQRIEAGTTDTVTVSDSSLVLTETRFIDNTSVNGTTYTYHLAFDVTGSDEKPVTMPDTVTPGPVFSWVDLIDFGQVVLFTPDFRDEVVSLDASFFGVEDIQVASTIWVLDSDGTIYRFQRNGELLGSGELTNVSAFAFHRFNYSVWVALEGQNGQIYHYQENGDLLGSGTAGVPVTSLAVDYLGQALWIGSSEPQIVKLNTTGTNISPSSFTDPDFGEPTLVVTATNQPGVWIGDQGTNKVINLTTAGIVWSRAGFSEVNDLAVDTQGDICWVADAKADEVTVLNGQNGNIIMKVTGFGNPFYLAYNSVTNSVLVSGSSGLITSLSPDGEILWRIQNPDRTGKIALAY